VENTKTARELFLTNLIKSFDLFCANSLKFLNDNFDSYFKVVFEEISLSKNLAIQFDKESCINFILDSKTDGKNIKFQHKQNNGSRWWDNEIIFPFINKMPEIKEWGTPKFWEYRNWRNELEYTTEYAYWANIENQKLYSPFSGLNIFNNVIFESNKLEYYKNIQNKFDKTIWLKYILDLITIFFPKYQYSKEFSTKNILRYVTQLKNDVWFGFEYDLKEIQYQLAKGYPELPDYFNLIAFNSNFDKTTTPLQYLYSETKSIISLGILGNPYFYRPCYTVGGYTAIDIYKKEELGNPYIKTIQQINHQESQIIHSVALNEVIKKHAFMYMHLLSGSSKSYLSYIENALLKTW
jgi:hypothetical protein